MFLAPETLAPRVRRTLEDALATQLALIQTRLRFETTAQRNAEPGELLQSARRIAAGSGAIGVFWLEAGTAWLLYAADARAERMVVRSLASPRKSAEPEADIEAVALLVRAATQALLRGEPLASSTREADTPKRELEPWPVEIQDGGRSALRIAVAYMGTTFSEHLSLQDGVALRGAWLMPGGGYVGLGFSLLRPASFNLGAVHFEIDRYPISLHGGLRFGVSRITFISELGVELEIRTRRTLSAGDLEPNRDDQRVIFNVCPKLEVELALLPWLVTFVNAGLDFVLSNYAYSNADETTMQARAVLQPHSVRLTLQLGVGLIR